MRYFLLVPLLLIFAIAVATIPHRTHAQPLRVAEDSLKKEPACPPPKQTPPVRSEVRVPVQFIDDSPMKDMSAMELPFQMRAST